MRRKRYPPKKTQGLYQFRSTSQYLFRSLNTTYLLSVGIGVLDIVSQLSQGLGKSLDSILRNTFLDISRIEERLQCLLDMTEPLSLVGN